MVGSGELRKIPPPVLAAVALLSDSELVIPFGFEGQEAVATSVRYTKLTLTVFSWGYLLVLLGLFSSSYSTDTNKFRSALGGGKIVPGIVLVRR